MALGSEPPSVAVIGLGISGLVAVKNLKEVGFRVTGFEDSSYIGGLWQYTEDAKTSVLPNSDANISKAKFCYTDFPYPDDVPHFPRWDQVAKYLNDYAKHFDLERHFRLNCKIEHASRFKDQWELKVKNNATGHITSEHFDKIVVCMGFNRIPIIPEIEGIEKFKGELLNPKTYKRPQDMKGKKVLIVGLGNTSVDMATGLIDIADKIYISHRRGALIAPAMVNSKPYDRRLTFKLSLMGAWLNFFDRSKSRVANAQRKTVLSMQNKAFPSIPSEWGLDDPPLLTYKVPIMGDELIPACHAGQITLVPGIRRILSSASGSNSVELTNDQVLEDIDTIIISAGYKGDYTSLFEDGNEEPASYDPTRDTTPTWSARSTSNGRPLARLYQGMFSLTYPLSLAYMETFNFSFSATINSDLASMAIAQIFAGNAKLPSLREMNRAVDEHHAMLLQLSSKGTVSPHVRNGWAWGTWCQTVAGCGVHERLGWGLRGWWFWFWNRKLHKLLSEGLFVPFMYRLFPSRSGRRKTWSGAMEAIEHVNRLD